MSKKEIRQANLRKWVSEHGTPTDEKSYFSQLLGGASFGEKAARRLEQQYGMGDGYLDEPTLGIVQIGYPSKLAKEKDIEIPQYLNQGGAMGGGILLRDQPGAIQGWRVTPEWITKNVKNHTGAANLCIVTGFGDSMQPMFNPGDPLLVDSGVKTVEFDSVYFFRVGNEGFVKRLQRIPGEGLRVLSKNKDYDSWTIKPDMDFEVFGRVIKVWCGSDF